MATIGAAGARSVVVVGVGAQTPVGRTAPASAAAVRAGICRFSQHPFMTDAAGEPMRVARIPWFMPELPLGERVRALIHGAAEEALSPLLMVLAGSRGTPTIGVVVALSDDRPGLPLRWRQEISDALLLSLRDRFKKPRVDVRSPGHAAGVAAIQRGCELLLNDEVEFCLAGGADSHLGPENLLQLEAREQLHGEDNPWGFVPGEGGGFCLLATGGTARRYGLPSLLELVSVAVTRERNTIGSKGVCTGAGLSQAVAQVLKAPRASKVDVIVTDQNGEPYRADEFGFTLARHARSFNVPPDLRAPAACWGDVSAASAPLFVNLIVASGQRRYAAGEYGLLLTSSEMEDRGAALVRLAPPPA
jgi:3-oxoacyl-[acyl-carrier-protein] synthase I